MGAVHSLQTLKKQAAYRAELGRLLGEDTACGPVQLPCNGWFVWKVEDPGQSPSSLSWLLCSPGAP